MSSWSRNCPVPRRWRARRRSSNRSKGSCWIRPVSRDAGAAGLSGATLHPGRQCVRAFSRVRESRGARQERGSAGRRLRVNCASASSVMEGAFIIVLPPPAVPGIGTGGGFAMRIEDRAGRGPQQPAQRPMSSSMPRAMQPERTSVFSPFSANTPQVFVDIDRQKAQMLGVPMQNVTEAMETCSARPMSTTSTFSAAQFYHVPRRRIIRSGRKRRIWRGCRPATARATW